jgi:hypothetical protein
MVKHAEVIDRNVFSLFQSTYCSNMLKHAEVIDRNVFSLFQSKTFPSLLFSSVLKCYCSIGTQTEITRKHSYQLK